MAGRRRPAFRSRISGKSGRHPENLYDRVQEVLYTNKKERHIRGGMATREKYRTQAGRDTARQGKKNGHPC